MVQLAERTFSGKVLNNVDDKLTLVLYTAEAIEDVAPLMCNISQITETLEGGIETIYNVTAPLTFKVASTGMLVFEFSTKPTAAQEAEARMQELSDAVDTLLVMVLEGT